MIKKALLGQLSDSDIRLLQIFRVVVESGGFSAAELDLNISRSTISRHIKDLEIRLGVTLCRRGRSGFSLTPEGRQVYEAALRMLAALDQFRSEVNDVHQQLTGTLTLAFHDMTVTNPNSRISEALAAFDELAPKVNIEIYIDNGNEIERGVLEGRFNVGIVPSHRPSSSLNYWRLFDEKMLMYCGKKHPLFAMDAGVAVDGLRQYKYAGLGFHSPNMETGRELEIEKKAIAYDQEAIAHLILSGKYIGFLPDHYAQDFVDQGLLKAVNPTSFNYQCEFQAITLRSPPVGRVVKKFIDLLQETHQ